MSLTLSIVTGTYNRLLSLIRMVESVRHEIPRGLAYEIVIVDGGSTDGTLDWGAAQPDVRLIEHGELRGAIKAFCDGARGAQGEYVLLANDDVTFKPYSILAALSHLERTPTCAGVAFADNRTSLVHGDGHDYRVEGMGATCADGQQTMVPYAQVGLFRRDLGNAAGWWGDADPIMGQARTYGGDNYLSARLWEMGYSIDPVPLAVIDDHIERDALRDHNASSGGKDSALYYQRFPTVRLPAQLQSVPNSERLRILYLPVYEWTYPGSQNHEAGLTEALTDYGLTIEIDYLNTEDFDLATLCQVWQPDLLLTQIQGVGPKLTAYDLAKARQVAPNMIIINWNGDAHEAGLIGRDMLTMLRYVDLQLTINAKVLPFYAAHHVRAAYWQIGYKDPVVPLPDMPAYDVLFQGNCYNQERDALVKALHQIRPSLTVGIYGNCPQSNGNTHYSFAAQRALYQRATITIGDTYPDTVAFVSNRLFQALSAGAFLLQQHSERLQDYTGLIPGVHYAAWTTLKDLKKQVNYWLDTAHADQRQQIARQGRDFVRANFSYPAQARKLFEDLLPLIAEEEGERVLA